MPLPFHRPLNIPVVTMGKQWLKLAPPSGRERKFRRLLHTGPHGVQAETASGHIFQTQDPLLNRMDIQKKRSTTGDFPICPARWRKEATLNDRLGNIAHCKNFITDSCLGICFALIFKRPFICIDNLLRGSGHFISLLELLHLRQRMLPEHADRIPDGTSLEMDYGAVNKIFQAQVHMEQSGQWFRNALSKKRSEALEHYNSFHREKINRKSLPQSGAHEKKRKNTAGPGIPPPCPPLTQATRNIHKNY